MGQKEMGFSKKKKSTRDEAEVKEEEFFLVCIETKSEKRMRKK